MNLVLYLLCEKDIVSEPKYCDSIIIGLTVFSSGSILYELYQAFNGKILDHFSDFWNWLDLFGCGSVLIFCILYWLPVEDTNGYIGNEWSLGHYCLLTASTCVPMRALSIMRLFKNTRYFIRMIEETIIDMIPFTIILYVVLFAFSLQNAALFMYSDEKNKTLTRYF